MAVSYTQVRKQLARIWDRVESTREEVILTRRGHEDLAILPAEELEGLRETAHLLRSPRNAARLLAALERSLRGEGTRASGTEELAARIGLPPKAAR